MKPVCITNCSKRHLVKDLQSNMFECSSYLLFDSKGVTKLLISPSVYFEEKPEILDVMTFVVYVDCRMVK